MSMHTVTADQYLRLCKRRFGTANPERVVNPVWEWMVRAGHNPYKARKSLGLEKDYETTDNPDWCFERMGTAHVETGDGRVITIAGEHEDFYDPDFCIYNDLVVRTGDAVEIHGYPKEVFPPTDFHTATLIGDRIFVIGSLGYQDGRGGPMTPAFVFDASSYQCRRFDAAGSSPGWIHGHQARLIDGSRIIEITDGIQVVTGRDNQERFRDNHDTYHLDVESATWNRITDHSSWRQFILHYVSHSADFRFHDKWDGARALKETGYPFEPAARGRIMNDPPARGGAHMLAVNGVCVTCRESWGMIHITVMGSLDQASIDELLARIVDVAKRCDKNVMMIDEI